VKEKPNIIEFIWHDLGDWLSCYNRLDVPSPCLQSLADDGVVLENHYCAAPQCSPSRATIKTGRYPQSHGILGLTHRGWRYKDGEEDLPLILRRAGYQTYLIGFQHEREDLAGLTYDESWTDLASAAGVSSASRTAAGPVADRTVEFLKSRAPASQPFFLSVGFFDVHRIFGTDYDLELAERLVVPGFLPDEPIVRKDLATFYERIRRADASVGRVLQALQEAGLEEDTLVYFTTDHGPEFPRAKMTLYDPGFKVALIFRYPRVISPGTRVRVLTSHVDVLPTLLEAAGIPIPENVQGRSMLKLLRGERYEPREAIFAQMTWHGGEYDPMRCTRTNRFKYIRNYMPGWPVQMGGPYTQRYGETFINRHFAHPRPAQELYDLETDPWEQNNLAESPGHQAIRKELLDRLEAWEEEVDDPILRGPIPCADPAKVGYACVWGKSPTRDPVKAEFRFSIVRMRDFGEEPL